MNSSGCRNTRSPEDAALIALGLEVIRSGTKVDPAARVYWERVGQADYWVDPYCRP